MFIGLCWESGKSRGKWESSLSDEFWCSDGALDFDERFASSRWARTLSYLFIVIEYGVSLVVFVEGYRSSGGGAQYDSDVVFRKLSMIWCVETGS